MTETYDVAIIGSGPGGYVAAIRAAQLGFKTVCIEKKPTLGGTCLNEGCIPSKALLHSSALMMHMQKEGLKHGIIAQGLTIDLKKMMEQKEQAVKSLVDGVAYLFKKHQITTIQGEAHFIDPHTVEVGENSQRIQADYFLIATGSEPIPLSALPFDEQQIVSSTGALKLSKIPERLLVVGGGVIGVELASVYSRLGSQVTVVEMLDHICPAMDHTMYQMFLQILKKQGIQFSLSTQVVTGVVQPNEVIVTLNQEDKLTNQSADVVLVAIGRRPYTKNLGLSQINIELTSKGFIAVDAHLRTSQPHIFAIGDVIDGPLLAHRASEEGLVVIEALAGQPASINYMAVPNVIYTSPEVAAVGMTEKEAQAAGLQLKIGMSALKGNPRARCTGETEGLVKIIGEARTDRLLGLHIISEHASEMIAEGMLAIQTRATLQDIAYAPYAHPTLSEAIREAAFNALGEPLHDG